MLNGDARPGDNKWTCSIVALNPDTGRARVGLPGVAARHARLGRRRGARARRRDVRRRDRGSCCSRPRATATTSCSIATTGKNLLTTPFAAVNWAHGDRRERAADPESRQGARSATAVSSRPNEAGATNYRSPSFDPATGLLIVSAADAYGIYFFKPEHGEIRLGRRHFGIHMAAASCARSTLPTGEVRWRWDLLRRIGRRGRADDGSGFTFTGYRVEERARAQNERRHDAVARRHRPRRQLADHLRARRAAVHAHRRRQRAVRVRAAGGLASHPKVMYLGLDLGTSALKAHADRRGAGGRRLGLRALEVSRPHPGWSEQSRETGRGHRRRCALARHKRRIAAVRGIGLSGQQHGATLLDKGDKVLRPAILWNDARSFAEAARSKRERGRARIAGNIPLPASRRRSSCG